MAVELPGDFFVWAASSEAKFLNGKFVWAHVCLSCFLDDVVVSIFANFSF